MMMSDLSFQRQLAALLSLVCHCWTFMVIDDKGGERLIKASGQFHLLIFGAGGSRPAGVTRSDDEDAGRDDDDDE